MHKEFDTICDFTTTGSLGTCVSGKGLHTASYYGSLSLVLENSEQLSSFLKPRTVLNTQCCFYPAS